MPDTPQQAVHATYNAAADCYDAGPLGFWEYFGRRTIERLFLRPGTRVLDVCCGSGASALPTAECVGPRGEVIGVDLAEKLLELAREKAARRGLTNVRFQTGDMLALAFPPGSFDAVVCVFGIFFVPDMAAALRALWSLVRPGGKLAITTWGPDTFEPGNSAFWDAVARIRPDLHRTFAPWDRISQPAMLSDLLAESGIAAATIESETRSHPIHSADDWWAIVMGTGYRGTVERLTTAEREIVKRTNLEFISKAKTATVTTNAIYASALKPG